MMKAHVTSHVGLVRPNNEDSCAVSAAPGRLSHWEGSLEPKGGWALVADGMGGHVAGEVASSLAIEVMRPLMPSLYSDRDVTTAINRADTALCLAMEQQPALRGMGTTIAGVVLRGDEALAFNVGDSRVYSFIGDNLTQLSEDHVVEDHWLTQCLGGAQRQMSLAPRIARIRVTPRTGILLCSDGLTDMLDDAAIARILAREQSDPVQALVGSAMDAGGYDNISAIFIGLHRAPHETGR